MFVDARDRKTWKVIYFSHDRLRLQQTRQLMMVSLYYYSEYLASVGIHARNGKYMFGKWDYVSEFLP